MGQVTLDPSNLRMYEARFLAAYLRWRGHEGSFQAFARYAVSLHRKRKITRWKMAQLLGDSRMGWFDHYREEARKEKDP